jgi:hypothetical protein
MVLVKLGGRYLHLLKMFGALFTFGCAFNVLGAAYKLSRAIEAAIKEIPLVVGNVFGAICSPIGEIFIWLGLMIVGLTLYRSDRVIVPIEEDIEEIKKKKAKKKK